MGYKETSIFRPQAPYAARAFRPRLLPFVAYVSCAVALVWTFSSLSDNPELSPFGWFHHQKRVNIIRPGQYVDLNGKQALVVQQVQQDESIEEVDETGTLHDQRDERFFVGGTLNLTSIAEPGIHPTPSIYDPYPAYNRWKWRKQYVGKFKPCLGPRGRDLSRTKQEDMMLVYKGKQIDFPDPAFGSYEAVGIDGNVCTDRYSRYGAYGYDQAGDEDVPGFSRPSRVDWSRVDWHDLQAQCLQRNADRYPPGSVLNGTQELPLSFEFKRQANKLSRETLGSSSQKGYHARSALLIRSWNSMKWTEDHRQYLRALIMELSLHSGGEYEVFLLVHVKDDELPIFSDPATVEALRNAIPEEFRNMALFFNTKMLEAWYPKIEEHSAMFQHHQPLQIFARMFPNFEYYWQLEMDGRHLGHAYHFFERAASFAREQPRKYLWERNAYFYIPGLHGVWSQFKEFVHNSLPDPGVTVWGPPLGTSIRPLGPNPPVLRPEDENYEWGVGEEADFISFLPIFNPKDTTWTFPDRVWNFKYGLDTPRRTAVVTMGRYSRRLLDLIHHAQATRGLGLASEMTGPSWAMYHGLKAVAIPQPIYADGKWTPRELNSIFNRGPPENINGDFESIWSWNHMYDHIMYRLTYMFTTHTGEDMYRRWLGFKTLENEGRKKSEEIIHGRHCFPSMFLHPIKNSEKRFGPDRAVP